MIFIVANHNPYPIINRLANAETLPIYGRKCMYRHGEIGKSGSIFFTHESLNIALLRSWHFKGEMDARSDMFLAVQEFGQSLLNQQHFAEEDITSRLEELENEKNQLYDCWQEQLHLLNQSYDLQVM